MTDQTYPELLRTVLQRNDLTRQQTYEAFMQIMDGQWSEAQISGLLVALAAKGECVDEIAGAAQAMREHVVRIDTGGLEVIDTCGTGGTGLKTFNISTTVAMVLAGAGIKVAKHGNRTNTRSSGSADVLACLGVNLDASAEVVTECIKQAGVGFCFAVRCHPAMKYAVPVRKSLGVRTIFNVLGPLTNPAGTKRQLMGVFEASLTETIAEVLGLLGATHAMVVHAEDGMDEISITAPTRVSQFKDGQVTTSTIKPEDFGMKSAAMDELLVSSPEESADRIRLVLQGKPGPSRDIVLLNAAAGIAVAGKVASISDGLAVAREAIDSGAAMKALETLVAVSNKS